MFDIDKWGPLQWLLGIGLAFGGAISAWMGARRSRNPPIEDNSSREARIEERERAELTARITEDRIRRDFEAAISAARKSFYDEFRRLDDDATHKHEQLEGRVRKLETDVEVLKARSQPPR